LPVLLLMLGLVESLAPVSSSELTKSDRLFSIQASSVSLACRRSTRPRTTRFSFSLYGESSSSSSLHSQPHRHSAVSAVSRSFRLSATPSTFSIRLGAVSLEIHQTCDVRRVLRRPA